MLVYYPKRPLLNHPVCQLSYVCWYTTLSDHYEPSSMSTQLCLYTTLSDHYEPSSMSTQLCLYTTLSDHYEPSSMSTQLCWYTTLSDHYEPSSMYVNSAMLVYYPKRPLLNHPVRMSTRLHRYTSV